jgi:hypothetical protein
MSPLYWLSEKGRAVLGVEPWHYGCPGGGHEWY